MSETYTTPYIQERVALGKILATPYPESETYATPQQELLAFAETMWGEQFDENGQTRWGCFSELGGVDTGKYAGVTDGIEYFTISDAPNKTVRRWLVSPTGDMCGVQEITLASSTTTAQAHQPTHFWL